MTTRRPGTTVPAVAGVVLAILLGAVVGVAVGALAAHLREPEPRALATAAPVPAVSPSYPVDPPAPVDPDPDTPALQPDLPDHLELIGGSPFGLRLPVPDGWTSTNSATGEWKWASPDQPDDHAYFLRVRLVSGFQTRESAIADRLDALDAASDVEDLVVESRDEDGFTATYVTDRHRRVAMERYLTFDGTTAYAVVAVVGRERDRAGMADLVERIADRAETG